MPLIDEYITAHIEVESEYMKRLYRETQVRILNPHMVSGHTEGRLLKMMVQMIHPKRILEIGTYTGYSALCMAEGLDDGAILHTFDINDELEDFTRPWVEGSPYASKIVLHYGDALTEVPKMEERFDMVFIDGDKREYTAYYHTVFDKTTPHAFILADNTLWDGHVIDERYNRDEQTTGIKAFNDLVAADPRVETTIVPIRDGLTIIRKKE